MKKIIVVLVMLFAACSQNNAAPTTGAANVHAGTTYVIGFTMREVKPTLNKTLEIVARIIFEVMERGDEILVVDTASNQEAARFAYPADAELEHQRLRQRYFQGEINRLLLYFKNHQTETNDGGLKLPMFVSYLEAKKQEVQNRPLKVLLLGSPFQSGEGVIKENMARVVWPDAVLCTKQSPFYARSGKKLSGVDIHFFHTGEFLNNCHAEGTKHFWGAYFAAQGARLMTFSGSSGDLRRLKIGGLSYEEVPLNCSSNKIERCASNPLLFTEEVSRPVHKVVNKAAKKPMKNSCK
jgi:hypothetical protein